MNKDFISLKSVAADLYGHPKMQDLPFELVISSSLELMQITGCPYLFEDKEEILHIHEHRAMLPCDYYDVRQIRLERPRVHGPLAEPLRAHEITTTYETDDGKTVTKTIKSQQVAVVPQNRLPESPMFKEGTNTFEDANFHPGADLTYKIQGNIVITSIPIGDIRIAYRAIKVDEDGWPMIISNASFVRALKSYIKMIWFTQKMECGELGRNPSEANMILNNAQQEYYGNIAQAQNSLLDLSPEKMRNIANIINDMMPRRYEHASGYNDLNKEHRLRTY